MPVISLCNLKLGRAMSFLADAFSAGAEQKVREWRCGRQIWETASELSPDFELQAPCRKTNFRGQRLPFSTPVSTGDSLT